MKKGATIFLSLAAIIGLAYFVLVRHFSGRVFREGHGLTRSEALHTVWGSMPLCASNVSYASSSHRIQLGPGGMATIYRLSCPLSNMMAYVESDKEIRSPYEPIQRPVEKPELYYFKGHDIRWFDVENIQTGYVAHGYEKTIWIDVGRSLFFFYSGT